MSVYTRDLIAERYGVLASPKPCTFLVVKPKDGCYEVNPVRKSCTCRAGELGKPCCHLTQLRDLLRAESRRMLQLSAETEDARHEAQLVAEVESLVRTWKEVEAARPTSTSANANAVSALPAATQTCRYAIYGQLRNNAWVTVLRGFTDKAEAERQQESISGNFYQQTSVRPDRSFVPGVA